MANGAGVVHQNGQANGVASGSKAFVAKPLPKPRLKAPVAAAAPAEAGPSSRRPPSPIHVNEPPKKKVKESSGIVPCPVCGQASIHLVGQCPIIREGPQRFVKFELMYVVCVVDSLLHRIETEIRRLRKDPTKAETVDKLQRILLRLRSRPS